MQILFALFLNGEVTRVIDCYRVIFQLTSSENSNTDEGEERL